MDKPRNYSDTIQKPRNLHFALTIVPTKEFNLPSASVLNCRLSGLL